MGREFTNALQPQHLFLTSARWAEVKKNRSRLFFKQIPDLFKKFFCSIFIYKDGTKKRVYFKNEFIFENEFSFTSELN